MQAVRTCYAGAGRPTSWLPLLQASGDLVRISATKNGESTAWTGVLLLFAYGLLAKVLMVYSVVQFDCQSMATFWIESGVLVAVAVVLLLLALWVAAPLLRTLSRQRVPTSDRVVATIGVLFAGYIGLWIVVLYSYVERGALVASFLRDLLGFSDVAC